MDLTFIKDADDRWYIDLPNWKGSKADLEMVCGADTFLDEISNRGHVVKLKVSLNFLLIKVPAEKNSGTTCKRG